MKSKDQISFQNKSLFVGTIIKRNECNRYANNE